MTEDNESVTEDDLTPAGEYNFSEEEAVKASGEEAGDAIINISAAEMKFTGKVC